mmetsp:Transcript_44508/g.87955  ORF Transcript_44508/g.87955 Transcript_44508/m.87955 type:complete len:279 (+) Transcript_44508:1378-2214(+)
MNEGPPLYRQEEGLSRYLKKSQEISVGEEKKKRTRGMFRKTRARAKEKERRRVFTNSQQDSTRFLTTLCYRVQPSMQHLFWSPRPPSCMTDAAGSRGDPPAPFPRLLLVFLPCRRRLPCPPFCPLPLTDAPPPPQVSGVWVETETEKSSCMGLWRDKNRRAALRSRLSLSGLTRLSRVSCHLQSSPFLDLNRDDSRDRDSSVKHRLGRQDSRTRVGLRTDRLPPLPLSLLPPLALPLPPRLPPQSRRRRRKVQVIVVSAPSLFLGRNLEGGEEKRRRE